MTLPFESRARAVCVEMNDLGRRTHRDHSKFAGRVAEIRVGPAHTATGGALTHMGLTQEERKDHRVKMALGREAIIDEVAQRGTELDQACLRYILFSKAGEYEGVNDFENGMMDCDSSTGQLLPERTVRSGPRAGEGMVLADFVEKARVVSPAIEEEHVIALRLYTTQAYTSINTPLRQKDKRHWWPVTLTYITEAINMLRQQRDSTAGGGSDVVDLFRGMRDLKLSAGFLNEGGVEVAPMSTTTDLNVAVDYAVRGSMAASLILKLRTPSFMQRGADIEFLSAFPSEKELVNATHDLHLPLPLPSVPIHKASRVSRRVAAIPAADSHEGQQGCGPGRGTIKGRQDQSVRSHSDLWHHVIQGFL